MNIIGRSYIALGYYQNGEVKPSIDVATKIAEALEVSLDYLVGYSEQLIERPILDRMTDIQKLSEQEQEYVFALLDAFIRDSKAKKAYS